MELEEARGEAQQAKKQRQRADQAVRGLEEEIRAVKSHHRRTADSQGTEDIKKEAEKCVCSEDQTSLV